MITTVIVLGLGSLFGGALGWKLGRAYERLGDEKKGNRPAGRDDKRKAERSGRKGT